MITVAVMERVDDERLIVRVRWNSKSGAMLAVLVTIPGKWDGDLPQGKEPEDAALVAPKTNLWTAAVIAALDVAGEFTELQI